MSGRIVITGGNGFIGSHITRYFCDRGEQVSYPGSKDLSVLDPQGLNEVISGADTVIHNAAKAVDWGSWKEFQSVNVEGTRNVLRACLQNNVRHVLMTGSCSVFGEEHCPVPKNEASPYNSHYRYFMDKVFPCAMNYYRDSKRQAVAEAKAFVHEYGLKLTIIHPVWVYGEREFHTGFYEYLKTVQGGIPAIMGSKHNLFHVIYAGDLAKAYYLAYQNPPEGTAEYIAGDPQPVEMDGLYRLFCEKAGLKKPPLVPKAIVYPPALLLELIGTMVRAKTPPLLTRGRVNMFYDSICYDTSRIEKELGFSCNYTLEQGVEKTVAWYKEGGYL